eukprot:UN33614
MSQRNHRKKHVAAAEYGCPIVRPDWVFTCLWEGKLIDPEEFCLQFLENKIICMTGYKKDKRTEIERKISKFGGTYQKFLNLDCQYLIAKEKSGNKYDFAAENGIPIVSDAWLWKCTEKIMLIPPKNFLLTEDDKQIDDVSMEANVNKMTTKKVEHINFGVNDSNSGFTIAQQKQMKLREKQKIGRRIASYNTRRVCKGDSLEGYKSGRQGSSNDNDKKKTFAGVDWKNCTYPITEDDNDHYFEDIIICLVHLDPESLADRAKRLILAVGGRGYRIFIRKQCL